MILLIEIDCPKINKKAAGNACSEEGRFVWSVLMRLSHAIEQDLRRTAVAGISMEFSLRNANRGVTKFLICIVVGTGRANRWEMESCRSVTRFDAGCDLLLTRFDVQ